MLELVVIGCLHGSHSFGVCDTIAWAGRKAGVKLSAGLDHMGPNPNCKNMQRRSLVRTVPLARYRYCYTGGNAVNKRNEPQQSEKIIETAVTVLNSLCMAQPGHLLGGPQPG